MKKTTEELVRTLLTKKQDDPKAKAKIASACWDLNQQQQGQ